VTLTEVEFDEERTTYIGALHSTRLTTAFHLDQSRIMMAGDDIGAVILLVEQRVKLLVEQMDPTRLDRTGTAVISPAL
jgi:hypothetical protein